MSEFVMAYIRTDRTYTRNISTCTTHQARRGSGKKRTKYRLDQEGQIHRSSPLSLRGQKKGRSGTGSGTFPQRSSERASPVGELDFGFSPRRKPIPTTRSLDDMNNSLATTTRLPQRNLKALADGLATATHSLGNSSRPQNKLRIFYDRCFSAPIDKQHPA